MTGLLALLKLIGLWLSMGVLFVLWVILRKTK